MKHKHCMLLVSVFLFLFLLVICGSIVTKKVTQRHGNTTTGNLHEICKLLEMPTGVEVVSPLENSGRYFANQAFTVAAVAKEGVLSNEFDYERHLELVEKPWPLSSEMAKAETKGASFKFSFLVVNDKDLPIEDANIALVAYNRHGSKTFPAKTKTNGIAVIEGFGTGEIRIEIEKNGYFHTSLRHWIFKPYLKCVEGQRWLPWNPLIKIQLTPKPSDCSAVAIERVFTCGKDTGVYGFDLVSGMHSSSTNCDMLISVEEDLSTIARKHPWHRYTVTFPGNGNGAQIVKVNPFSECRHPTNAPESGYTNRLEFAGWKPIGEDEAIVYKIRNSETGQPFYGVFTRSFLPVGTGLTFRFHIVINVKRNVKTLVSANTMPPLPKFFNINPLEISSMESTGK